MFEILSKRSVLILESKRSVEQTNLTLNDLIFVINIVVFLFFHSIIERVTRLSNRYFASVICGIVHQPEEVNR